MRAPPPFRFCPILRDFPRYAPSKKPTPLMGRGTHTPPVGVPRRASLRPAQSSPWLMSARKRFGDRVCCASSSRSPPFTLTVSPGPRSSPIFVTESSVNTWYESLSGSAGNGILRSTPPPSGPGWRYESLHVPGKDLSGQVAFKETISSMRASTAMHSVAVNSDGRFPDTSLKRRASSSLEFESAVVVVVAAAAAAAAAARGTGKNTVARRSAALRLMPKERPSRRGEERRRRRRRITVSELE